MGRVEALYPIQILEVTLLDRTFQLINLKLELVQLLCMITPQLIRTV